MNKSLIVIAGPTAIGKTSLAIKLAEYYRTEIISADSRQFYREMSIGTAKPSAEELQQVKHHFINSHSIQDNFSAGEFEKSALELLKQLFKEHDKVIMAGGSGLFIDAICEGFDDLPVASAEHREQLNSLFTARGISHLQERLKEVDPNYYSTVDLNNPQRIIRALEVYESTGQTFSSLRNRTKKQRAFDCIKIGLNTGREKLYQQINSRVDLMISSGLVEEARGLITQKSCNALNTVGYSELFAYFEGGCTLEEAIEKIKQNTRRFAKRQLTWFRNRGEYRWFEPTDFQKIVEFIDSGSHSKS